MSRPLRALAWFWSVLLLALAGGAIALQVAGPPPARSAASVAQPAAASNPAPRESATALGGIGRAELPALRPAPGAATGAAPAVAAEAPRPIRAAEAALLEPAPDFPGKSLPRIGADRHSPMLAYAAAADPAETRPRIAILISGIGLSRADGTRAIAQLPPAVSLAVSPYADHVAALLDAARARGHEVLMALPMEPDDYPIDDPGTEALLRGNSAAENARRLEWALSRFDGYVGATDALGAGLRGASFARDPTLMRPVLRELARRGLLFVEARPGAARPPEVVGRAVDVVLDDPANPATMEARLGALEQAARARGSAIGLADLPEPTLVSRIAAWAAGLPARGLALMPVSAVVPMVPRGQAEGATPGATQGQTQSQDQGGGQAASR